MIFYFRWIFLWFPFFSWASGVSGISVTGVDGVEIHLNQPAHRVIALAPNLTEILFDIGAGETVVGVGEDSDFPKAAQNLPVVSGIRTINLERIVSLHPDLVIVWEEGTSPLGIEALRKLQIPVLVTETSHLSDIPVLMQTLGAVTGHDQEAQKHAERFINTLNFYQKQNAQREKAKIKVFIQIGLPPLFTAGGESIQSEIIETCGGVNIFADIPRAASEVSMEAVIAKNPDLIIGMAPLDISIWEKFNNLTAVKNKAELAIDPDIFARNGPRTLLAIQQVCAAMGRVSALKK